MTTRRGWLRKHNTKASFAFIALGQGTFTECEHVTDALINEVGILSPGTRPAEPLARVLSLRPLAATAAPRPRHRRRGHRGLRWRPVLGRCHHAARPKAEAEDAQLRRRLELGGRYLGRADFEQILTNSDRARCESDLHGSGIARLERRDRSPQTQAPGVPPPSAAGATHTNDAAPPSPPSSTPAEPPAPAATKPSTLARSRAWITTTPDTATWAYRTPPASFATEPRRQTVVAEPTSSSAALPVGRNAGTTTEPWSSGRSASSMSATAMAATGWHAELGDPTLLLTAIAANGWRRIQRLRPSGTQLSSPVTLLGRLGSGPRAEPRWVWRIIIRVDIGPYVWDASRMASC